MRDEALLSTDPQPDFAARYGPRALILGGSEGIGASFATQLAQQGFDLTLVARNRDALDATAAAIRAAHGVDVDTQILDLTDPAIQQHVAALFDRQDFGLVIYNAGAVHGVGRFLDQPVDKAVSLVRLNCIGPVVIAHRALSAMRARKRGGLILLSSMSGLAGSGFVATYAAVKSFEILLAEGLNWELARDGVDILCAVATLTDTPAMARSGMITGADTAYVPMDPADVAVGALAHLGRTPVWYAAGEAAAAAIQAVPRADLIDGMSRTSAALWGLEV